MLRERGQRFGLDLPGSPSPHTSRPSERRVLVGAVPIVPVAEPAQVEHQPARRQRAHHFAKRFQASLDTIASIMPVDVGRSVCEEKCTLIASLVIRPKGSEVMNPGPSPFRALTRTRDLHQAGPGFTHAAAQPGLQARFPSPDTCPLDAPIALDRPHMFGMSWRSAGRFRVAATDVFVLLVGTSVLENLLCVHLHVRDGSVGLVPVVSDRACFFMSHISQADLWGANTPS